MSKKLLEVIFYVLNCVPVVHLEVIPVVVQPQEGGPVEDLPLQRWLRSPVTKCGHTTWHQLVTPGNGCRRRWPSRPQPRPRHEALIVPLPPVFLPGKGSVFPGKGAVFREARGLVEVEAVAAPEEGPTLLLLVMEDGAHVATAAVGVARPPADHVLGDAVEPGTEVGC